MLFTEWNLKDALEVAKEEGEAMGMEKVFALLDKGYSSAEIKKALAKKQ
jgi:hypothetical protein